MPAMSETIWFLKRCDLFERLTPAEKQRLERRAVVRTFKRRDTIYFPAEPGQSVLVLAQGRVKIKVVAPDGKETIFAFIQEGELFGELAVLDSAPRNEFAEAAPIHCSGTIAEIARKNARAWQEIAEKFDW